MIGKANPNDLIEKVAEKLKNVVMEPEWAPFVKTGHHKERVPDNKEWWYIRAASILRKIHIQGPIGVSKLSTLYGGRKNRGYKPERFYPGSSHIIRTILQQLEKAELVKQDKKGVHKGRVTTPQGISLMDKTENEIVPKKQSKSSKKEESKPKEASKKEEKKVEKKAEQTSKASPNSAKEQVKKEAKEETKETPKEVPKEEAKK